MVRIEKAYTGYCTHHEEASQTLQELEKLESVKVWLEVKDISRVANPRDVSDAVRTEPRRGTSIP